MSRTEPVDYARSWALDDIHILRAKDGHGDGRTVEAYAAVFDIPAEIHDKHGHYMETIARTAFKRTLDRHGISRVGVFYHHGLTLHGTPSDLGAVPIGSPVEIRPDAKGLRTITRYNRSELGDAVIEAIRNDDLRGYSFRGPIYKSNPARVPRARSGDLPKITRTELGLLEYGPTPSPAYVDAGILAMRSTLDEIREELASLSRNISSPTPADPDDEHATPDPGPGAEDPRTAHSVRLRQLALKRAVRERGM